MSLHFTLKTVYLTIGYIWSMTFYKTLKVVRCIYTQEILLFKIYLHLRHFIKQALITTTYPYWYVIYYISEWYWYKIDVWQCIGEKRRKITLCIEKRKSFMNNWYVVMASYHLWWFIFVTVDFYTSQLIIKLCFWNMLQICVDIVNFTTNICNPYYQRILLMYKSMLF